MFCPGPAHFVRPYAKIKLQELQKLVSSFLKKRKTFNILNSFIIHCLIFTLLSILMLKLSTSKVIEFFKMIKNLSTEC